MSLAYIPKHIAIVNKEDCCGCTSCYAVCPKSAIRMCEDEQGFKYPKVDESMCVDCGMCIKSCTILNGNQNEKTRFFYAVKHKREEIRAASSSGGIFSAIAKEVIVNNGVIYGAAYDDNFVVRHIRTDDESWERLRTSKYVQSDMGDIFSSVKNDLEKGINVLFTGTPCQVDGLKTYLKDVDTTKLITCDLICHGVPSPKIWQEYLKLITSKTGKTIEKVNFRNKEGCGWHNSTVKIESTEGSVIVNESQSQGFFFKLFLNHLILRPSCFSCHYANLNRAGDITIGDYWGVENHHPELDDDKGTSLVMVNTKKGEEILKKITEDCELVCVLEEECMQPNLIAPAKDYGRSGTFWRTYKKYGLECAGKRIGYLKMSGFDKGLIFMIRVLDKISRGFQKI